MEQGKTGEARWKLWLKRVGIGGFFFFLIKGLVWIGVFIFLKNCSGL
ncbi:MAG: hypothetical protein JJU28_07170 [Cyclobacteriaceae bacterium]|nr:hypothetical protein [Cyclobacteriaceae bacterium]